MDKYFEALQKSKGSIALSIADQVGYDGTADVLEKGRVAAMGEIREWNGIKYQKTPKGWTLVKKQEGNERESLKKFAETLEDWGFPVHGWSIKKNKKGYGLKVTAPIDQKWIPESDTLENQERKMRSVLDSHEEDLKKMGLGYSIDVVPGGRGTLDLACYFKPKSTKSEKKEDKTSEAKDMPKFHSEYAEQFKTLINSYEKGTLAEKKAVMKGLGKIELAAFNSSDSEEGKKVYADCLAVRDYVSKPRGTVAATDFKTVREIINKTLEELKPETKGIEDAQKGDTLIDDNGDEWEVLSEPMSEWEEVEKYDNGGMEEIIEEEGIQGPFVPVKNKEGKTAVFAVDETRELKLKKS